MKGSICSSQSNPRFEYFNKKLSRHHYLKGKVMAAAVNRVIENQDRYYALLRSTQEPGIEQLIDSIHNSTFFKAHSHSHHHYATGLVEHSLGVYDQMMRLSEGTGLQEKDIILTALLHDICMAHNDAWPHESGRHGKNSRLIAEKYLPHLSQEVKKAIQCHRYDPKGNDIINHPLWTLVRKCDIADSATSPGKTLKFMELGLGHKEDVMDKHFNKERILALLRATKRKNIRPLTNWLYDGCQFFEAPASVNKHNVFRGGLAKHSLDVYNAAMELNKSYNLPEDSIVICSLLHDICKHDQYYIDAQGKPRSKKKMDAHLDHGFRSKEIIKSFDIPLSHDEEMAIWWHMGQYENSKDDYPKEYAESMNIPLVKLINQADGIAAAKGMK